MVQTAAARDSVEFLERQGVVGPKLAPHQERLAALEAREEQLRQEHASDVPADTVVPIDLDEV